MVKELSPEARVQKIKEGRDRKARNHFLQYAPVWIVDEEVRDNEDSVFFSIVFRHPRYGWVSRRYHYDAFTDVLYQKGQRQLDEAETFDFQTQEPYIETSGANTVLSYGG